VNTAKLGHPTKIEFSTIKNNINLQQPRKKEIFCNNIETSILLDSLPKSNILQMRL